jgi:hypothetical protein
MEKVKYTIIERIIVGFCVFIVIDYLGFIAQRVWRSANLVNIDGDPVGADFSVFWTVSKLSLEGKLAEAYHVASLMNALGEAIPQKIWNGGYFIWAYPPSYSLINWPLALLDYVPAYFAWMAITFTLFFFVGRSINRYRVTPWLIAAFPGAFFCIISGQNGLLTAAILGLGFLLLPHRPLLAGIFFGLLSLKPQVALLLPIALIFGRQWQAFASAAITTGILVVASILVFGVHAWLVFFEALPEMSKAMQLQEAALDKMPSLYPFLQSLGVSGNVALFCHLVLAGVVAVVTSIAWLRSGPTGENIALVITAGAVVAPYIFGYDMTIIGVALLFLVRDVENMSRGERYFLILVWFSPLLNPVFEQLLGRQLGWVILIGLVYWCWRRGQSRPLVEPISPS